MCSCSSTITFSLVVEPLVNTRRTTRGGPAAAWGPIYRGCFVSLSCLANDAIKIQDEIIRTIQSLALPTESASPCRETLYSESETDSSE
jgi:hypothetical protein